LKGIFYLKKLGNKQFNGVIARIFQWEALVSRAYNVIWAVVARDPKLRECCTSKTNINV